MKVSIFTTAGNEKETPQERGDPYEEAISCYKDLADEVIVVAGTSRINKIDGVGYVFYDWPWEFDWTDIPKHMNAGLERCTGDWAIRMDLDTLVHESDIVKIRSLLAQTDKDIVTFEKFNLITHDKCIQKCDIPLAIRTGRGIKLGKAKNKKTDLCWPVKVDKKLDEYMYEGSSVMDRKFRSGIPVIAYDCTFKTKDQIIDNFWRFSKAHNRYFGGWQWGSNPTEAYQTFIDMMRGRYKRSRPFKDHPKYINEKVKKLKSNQFGYNGWGRLDDS